MVEEVEMMLPSQPGAELDEQQQQLQPQQRQEGQQPPAVQSAGEPAAVAATTCYSERHPAK